MRSTVRIDDDLMVELERRTHDASVSLTRMLNHTLRVGLAAPERPMRARPYKQHTFAMGRPLADLDKALALAAHLEDEEVGASGATHLFRGACDHCVQLGAGELPQWTAAKQDRAAGR